MTTEITRGALSAYIVHEKIQRVIFKDLGADEEALAEFDKKIKAAEQLYVRMGFSEIDKRIMERKNKLDKYRRII